MRVLSVDLGQAVDYTAIALIELNPGPVYLLRELYRAELKTPYPKIVDMVGAAMRGLQDMLPERKCQLVVDATGVGVPVVDAMRQAKLVPIAVTITGGDTERRLTGNDDWCWRVPKRSLVSNAQLLFQQRQLKIAGSLRLGKTFTDELEAFKVKIDPLTAHDSYSAGREGVHDDLVMAVCLALWWARKFAKPTKARELIRGTTEWYEAREEAYIDRLAGQPSGSKSRRFVKDRVSR